MKMRQLAGAILLAFSAAAFAAPPTIDQLLRIKSVSRPRISPDARFVAFDKSETDWKENAYVTHLWLADTQSGRTFQLTRGRKSTTDAQWSPDGRWIAFMTERESDGIAGPDEKAPDPKPDARQI